jgi:hypothetical protein
MTDWRNLKVEGLGPVAREVAVFQVGPPLARLPFASFKVKVIERPDGSYLGLPNVARRSADGSPDWIGGLGASIEEALEDTLRWFVRSLNEDDDTTEEDFVWAAPEDF